MARYKGYQCDGCQQRIYKGSLCDVCRKKSLEAKYGLSFGNGGYARPSQKFWRAWRKDSDAVKRSGLSVLKDDGGWWVRRRPRMM